MHDDYFIHLNLQANNDVNEGNDYIECWKFTIPKCNIHHMKASKKIKNIKEHETKQIQVKGKMMIIIDMYIISFTT